MMRFLIFLKVLFYVTNYYIILADLIPYEYNILQKMLLVYSQWMAQLNVRPLQGENNNGVREFFRVFNTYDEVMIALRITPIDEKSPNMTLSVVTTGRDVFESTVPINYWTSIQVAQFVEQEEQKIFIIINDTVIQTTTNPNPVAFLDVTMVGGGTTEYPTADVLLGEIKFITFPINYGRCNVVNGTLSCECCTKCKTVVDEYLKTCDAAYAETFVAVFERTFDADIECTPGSHHKSLQSWANHKLPNCFKVFFFGGGVV